MRHASIRKVQKTLIREGDFALLVAIGLVVGIFTAIIVAATVPFSLLYLCIGLVIGGAFFNFRTVAFQIGLLIASIFLGFTIGMIEREKEMTIQATFWDIEPKIFSGRVISIPRHTPKSTQLTLKLSQYTLHVVLPAQAPVTYGDYLSLEGTFTIPTNTEEFNNNTYLRGQNIFLESIFPKILSIDNIRKSLPIHPINFSQKLKKRLLKSYGEQIGSLYVGIIVGDTLRLPKDFKRDLTSVGLRHLTAVSGLHITVIIAILVYSIVYFGAPLRIAYLASIAIISLYILGIGAPASAIRAGIMGFLATLSYMTGRPGASLRFLIYAATIMLILNPFLIVADIGFQLSFLATLGIILMNRPMLQFLEKIVPFDYPRSIIAITLSAQFFVLPLLIHHFGQISIISPLANTLVAPIIGFAIISGLVGLLSGYFGGLGFIIALPAIIIGKYIVTTTTILAQIPYHYIEFHDFSWQLTIFLYTVIAYITFTCIKTDWQ